MERDYDYASIKENAGKPSASTLVRVRKPDDEWVNVKRDFLRLPAVGEYIAIDLNSPLFRVTRVVHVPFTAPVGAEVYCTEPYATEIEFMQSFGQPKSSGGMS